MTDLSEPSAAVPIDPAVVSRLIREEIDRNNSYLQFAQTQIEKDRIFFGSLYKIAAAFLLLLVAGAGVLQYSSIAQMRADMASSVNATIVEANTKIAQELSNVRAEVAKRVDNEFRGENITSLVIKAAKERTANELQNIIRAEVSGQVAKGLEDQAPEIRQIIEGQTKDAVIALEPTIRSAVDKATQQQVHVTVEPIRAQMGSYDLLIQLGNLATLARGDDRPAFEYLLQVVAGNRPESQNADVRKLAESTATAIIYDKKVGVQLQLQFKIPQAPDAMRQSLRSKNPIERQAALDNYPENDKTILPILVEMIKTDKSISVTYKSVQRFNALTKQEFEFWRTDDLLAWWRDHEGEFR